MTHPPLRRALRACALGLLLLPLASHCGGRAEGNGGTDAGLSFGHCAEPSECAVRSASCCGSCGAATPEDLVAVRADELTAYSTHACQGTQGCPACYMEQDARLVATCAAERCQPVNLALHAATACAADGDCRLRTSDCCECGGAADRRHLLALNTAQESAFTALVCDTGAACPECAPLYPSEATARCVAGHCVAEWAGLP